jgi:outer membrane biosynthesis protein TonB
VALTDEQNAMLRLLTSGEQGYADIAALLGQSEDEVRAKVVGALAQLQAEGKPAPNVPPPIPGGAKPAAEVTPPEPEPVEQAPAASEESTEPAIADAVAPSAPAPAPKTPAQPGTPKPAATPPVSPPPSKRPPSGGRSVTLPSGRNAWLLGGGIIAAIAVIVVVILLVSGGGGGGSSTASTEAPTTPAGESEAEEGKAETTSGAKTATEAVLKAVDGSEAKGFASFGRVKNKLALQIEATGLEPTEEGTTSYAIWLAESPRKMIPLASTGVKATGKGANAIAAQFEVPVEILGYLASGTFDQVAVTRVVNKRFETAIEVATKSKTTPTYYGEEVLRGTITGPIVGLAVREEEKKKAEEAGE